MKYAIIESGGKQYQAVENTTIMVDLLTVEAGQQVTLDEVLLVVDGDNVSVGAPTVKGAKVQTTVVGHEKGPKTIQFKYSPKKRIRTKTGHRQLYTRLQVDTIVME